MHLEQRLISLYTKLNITAVNSKKLKKLKKGKHIFFFSVYDFQKVDHNFIVAMNIYIIHIEQYDVGCTVDTIFKSVLKFFFFSNERLKS